MDSSFFKKPPFWGPFFFFWPYIFGTKNTIPKKRKKPSKIPLGYVKTRILYKCIHDRLRNKKKKLTRYFPLKKSSRLTRSGWRSEYYNNLYSVLRNTWINLHRARCTRAIFTSPPTWKTRHVCCASVRGGVICAPCTMDIYSAIYSAAVYVTRVYVRDDFILCRKCWKGML